jgi:small-conductance mechanosensitive channel
VGLLLLVLGRLVLPKEARSRLRLPAAAFFLHVALMAVRVPLPDESAVGRVLAYLALLLLLLSIGRTGYLITARAVVPRALGRPMPKIFGDIVQGAIYAGALLLTLIAAGVEPGSLLTTSALLTAVLGLALQDTLGNLFAGLAIQAQRPFEVGDWIQFDDKQENVGMVVEINWRAATVLTLDQIEVTVPNNQLARAPIRNFTKPLPDARRIVFVHAAYAVPPRRVERLILTAIRDIPGVLAEPAPSVIPFEFDERGVRYQVRYFLREFRERENIDAAVRERIWYALARANIDVPVPQRFIELHQATQEEERAEARRHVDEREAHLRKVDFLDALPADAVGTLAGMSETRLYDDSEVIIREGDGDEEFFIVVRGQVSIRIGKRAQTEVARLGPGQFFGEMSLMTGEKRAATVRAVGECELLVVGKEAFHHVFDLHPELMQRISEVLAAREQELGAMRQRESDRPSSPAGSEARRAELLSRIRDFFSL